MNKRNAVKNITYSYGKESYDNPPEIIAKDTGQGDGYDHHHEDINDSNKIT